MVVVIGGVADGGWWIDVDWGWRAEAEKYDSTGSR